MDVTLQRHCARFIYPVPDGLHELLSDISREVLRSQPQDIYSFIADYLDALLITRENARVSARFVQDMTEASETVVSLLKRTGMTREEANKTAEIIQHTFKTWGDHKGILKEDDDAVVGRIIENAGLSEGQVQTAAVVIQWAFKMYKIKQQKESKLLSGIIDWRVAARSAIKLYRRTGVSPEEAKRAASLIKAAYKGYYTRRTLAQLQEEGSVEEEPDEASEESESSESGSDHRKEVRIDFQTVVPHVAFSGEEYILHEDESEATEEAHKTDEEFIYALLSDMIENITVPEEEAKLPDMDTVDEIIDDFIPSFDASDQPLYSKAPPLSMVTEEELQMELEELKHEAEELKEGAAAKRALKSEPEEKKTKPEIIQGQVAEKPVTTEAKDGKTPKITEKQPEDEPKTTEKQPEDEPKTEGITEEETPQDVEEEEPPAATETNEEIPPEVKEDMIEEASQREEDTPQGVEEEVPSGTAIPTEEEPSAEITDPA